MTDDEREQIDAWRAQSAEAHRLLNEAGIGERCAGLHIRVAALIREHTRLENASREWEARARELESLCADRL